MTSRAQHIVLRQVVLSRQCNNKILPSSKENMDLPQNLPQIQFTILTSRNRKLRDQKGPPIKSKWPNGSRRKFQSVHPWLVLHQNPPEKKAKKSRNKFIKKRKNQADLIQSLKTPSKMKTIEIGFRAKMRMQISGTCLINQ